MSEFERGAQYRVRLIAAVMANVTTKSGEPLNLNVSAAMEMVGEIVDEMLLERGFEKFKRGMRKR